MGKELFRSHLKHQDSFGVADAAKRVASGQEAMRRRLEDASTAKVATLENEVAVLQKQEARYKLHKEKRMSQHAKVAEKSTKLASEKAGQEQRIVAEEAAEADARTLFEANTATLKL